jgi:PHP family Zn ribbon phosphoesterase/energy-coupling factor transporter ATP-binding protein EcfA2
LPASNQLLNNNYLTEGSWPMGSHDWGWSGARWWSFDFHSHTPVSDDYGKGPDQAEHKNLQPREWLLNYMRAGVDCVAVTDHNSGAWIDPLKSALAELRDEGHSDYRPLVIFPGVEVSVQGGVHLLAIFAPTATTSDIDSLLGAAVYKGTKGSSDGVTLKSFSEVCQTIADLGGIAIPAHVDCPSGLFTELSGQTLIQALNCTAIVAAEVIDPGADKPPVYKEHRKHPWTEVRGSDAHHPWGDSGQRYPGSHFTWVKMGKPTIGGLRLALLDGKLSVRRSDEVLSGAQNTSGAKLAQDEAKSTSTSLSAPLGSLNEQHGDHLIESIEVDTAYFMGRGAPFCLRLNPWLNAVIGGRGTGKSSLVEFLRSAMRRFNELPAIMKGDLEKYREASTGRDHDGLLTEDTQMAIYYRKQGARFRINWSPNGTETPIEEEQSDGSWASAEGEITQRFPIRIYSQKQIYQLAKQPAALMRIIDDASDVDKRSWLDQWKSEETRFLSLRAKVREIEDGLSEESRIRGELADVERKMKLFEETDHADILKEYQSRQKQVRGVSDWEETWQNAGESIREVADGIVPQSLGDANLEWDLDEKEEDRLLGQKSEEARSDLSEIANELRQLAERANDVLSTWKEAREQSDWNSRVKTSTDAYENLEQTLAAEGAGDPSQYGVLVKERQRLEQRLNDFDERRQRAKEKAEEADECLERLKDLRRELTAKRRAFLKRVLTGNRFVRISVEPYGEHDSVEADLRALLGLDGQFEKDLGKFEGDSGFLSALSLSGDQTDIEESILALKQQLLEVRDAEDGAADVRDQRFAQYLNRLSPEVVDRLELWFPEDRLNIEYSATSDGKSFSPIRGGSPGQMTAALLAFLLSYGDEPLVLDQPEDDLDNYLIYKLIVHQLREVKQRRQVIVVTHNPNIVVNGDAELVAALEPRNGQTVLKCNGSLQEGNVRDTICHIMEGGRIAFEQRYRRIALDNQPQHQKARVEPVAQADRTSVGAEG